MITYQRIQQGDGTARTEWKNEDYELHRIDGPALTIYYKSGNVHRNIWFYEHKWHRLKGPAFIEFNQHGIIEQELWYASDRMHRLDGPAHIRYHNNGMVEMVEWYINHNKIKNPPDHYPLSREEQVEMKILYG